MSAIASGRSTPGFPTNRVRLVVYALSGLLLGVGAGIGLGGASPAPSGTVAVGSSPFAVAYAASNHELYVSNAGSNTVSVLSSNSNAVLATIPVGGGPGALAYDPSNRDIFVANDFSQNVSVISTATNTVVANIPVGQSPIGVAYDGHNHGIYVVNQFSDNVSVIPGGSFSSSISIGLPTSSYPWGIAYDSANHRLYVAEYGSNSVAVLDGTTNSAVATVGVGTSPEAVTFDPQNDLVYVANAGSNNVSAIDGSANAVVATVALPSGNPSGIAYDPLGAYVDVSEYTLGEIEVVSGASNQVVASLSVGTGPLAMTYDVANHRMYVANQGSATVSYFGGRSYTPLGTLAFPQGTPYGMAFDPHNNLLYVANYQYGYVQVVNPSNLSFVATLGNIGPYSVVYCPTNHEVYAASYWSQISVINDSTNTVNTTFKTPHPVAEATFDPANGLLYFTEYTVNATLIVNPRNNSIVGEFAVGGYPLAITYDPVDRNVYILNSATDNVSIYSPTAGAVVKNLNLSTTDPTGIAYNPASRDVDAVGYSYTNFFVISSVTHTVIANLSVGPGFYDEAVAIAYDAANGEMAISEPFGPITWVDAASQAVAWTPVSSTVYDGFLAYDSHDRTMFADTPPYTNSLVEIGS